MHRLGISVYPEKSTQKEVYDYLELAAKYGFSRIFTCLLSVNDPKEKIMKDFGEFMDKAHSLGYVVAVDTSTVTEILPAYLKEDDMCFVDKLGNVYYYSEYSGAFHQSVYKLKHFDFDENESFIITVKEYCDV